MLRRPLSIEDVWVIPLLKSEKITTRLSFIMAYFKLNLVVVFSPFNNTTAYVSGAGLAELVHIINQELVLVRKLLQSIIVKHKYRFSIFIIVKHFRYIFI